MTMCDRHPLQAQVLLREISKLMCQNQVLAADFAMQCIFAQIQWKVHSPADCSFDTPNGVIFVAKLDIAQLNQVLSHTIRNILLRKIPIDRTMVLSQKIGKSISISPDSAG